MTSHRQRLGGYLLLETMMGVAIFALGMLALARAVECCVDTEGARAWDARARVALANRMAEIEAGAVALGAKTDELDGSFSGITLAQQCGPLRLEDEQKRALTGLEEVRLEARWKSHGTRQSKELVFYVLEKH